MLSTFLQPLLGNISQVTSLGKDLLLPASPLFDTPLNRCSSLRRFSSSHADNGGASLKSLPHEPSQQPAMENFRDLSSLAAADPPEVVIIKKAGMLVPERRRRPKFLIMKHPLK